MLLGIVDGLLLGLVLDVLLPGREVRVQLLVDHIGRVLDVLGDLVLLAVELLRLFGSDQILEVDPVGGLVLRSDDCDVHRLLNGSRHESVLSDRSGIEGRHFRSD